MVILGAAHNVRRADDLPTSIANEITESCSLPRGRRRQDGDLGPSSRPTRIRREAHPDHPDLLCVDDDVVRARLPGLAAGVDALHPGVVLEIDVDAWQMPLPSLTQRGVPHVRRLRVPAQSLGESSSRPCEQECQRSDEREQADRAAKVGGLLEGGVPQGLRDEVRGRAGSSLRERCLSSRDRPPIPPGTRGARCGGAGAERSP